MQKVDWPISVYQSQKNFTRSVTLMPNVTLNVWTRCKARGKIDFYAPITNDFYYETDAYREVDRIYGLKEFQKTHKYGKMRNAYYF